MYTAPVTRGQPGENLTCERFIPCARVVFNPAKILLCAHAYLRSRMTIPAQVSTFGPIELLVTEGLVPWSEHNFRAIA